MACCPGNRYCGGYLLFSQYQASLKTWQVLRWNLSLLEIVVLGSLAIIHSFFDRLKEVYP